jgi:hypothetical protein
MEFFTVTYPILGTNIQQNSEDIPTHSVATSTPAIPVPELTPAHNQESSYTIQLPIELNSLHYKGQKLRNVQYRQRVPGRSPEITRLRGSGNMELRFKLTATIVYGYVSSVCF